MTQFCCPDRQRKRVSSQDDIGLSERRQLFNLDAGVAVMMLPIVLPVLRQARLQA